MTRTIVTALTDHSKSLRRSITKPARRSKKTGLPPPWGGTLSGNSERIAGSRTMQ